MPTKQKKHPFQKILQQGAEAVLIKENNKLIKKRIEKGYRLREIDEKLRKQRTKKEAKLLDKLQGKIPAPKILKVNEQDKEIVMQFIEGKKLSEHLDKLKNKEKIMECIGEQVAALHNNGVIHGDLTTSNMILKQNKVYFIDFGLSFYSTRVEDKAVDLHLLRQALEAKHFKYFKQLFNPVLKGYKTENKDLVLMQLKKVELRGRYKH
jgi:TP53 regulating kinase-like protein